LNRLKKAAATTAVLVAGIALFAWAPLISYSVSFSMYQSSSYPVATTTGHSTLMYRLTGLGAGPYPPEAFITQGNSSALVHFSGTKIAYWEGPFSPDTALDPAGIVKITSANITQWAFGLLNFTVAVTNVGVVPVWNLSVIIHYPTYGTNHTVGGFVHSSAPAVSCARSLPPNGRCVAVATLPQSSTLLTDEDYQMNVEAWSPGRSGGGFAGPFVHVRTFVVKYPGAGISQGWVTAFVSTVNAQRGGTPLKENKTFDEFAAFRYASIRSQYQISDYNFGPDYYRYFGSTGPTLLEEILYPAGQNPTTFPTFLQKYAPGHWSGLVDSIYSQYGYFFGTGPAIEVGPGCTATEVPGPNINVTQYAISHGCSYVVADEIYFILILGK
jgi:hypothetical protein